MTLPMPSIGCNQTTKLWPFHARRGGRPIPQCTKRERRRTFRRLTDKLECLKLFSLISMTCFLEILRKFFEILLKSFQRACVCLELFGRLAFQAASRFFRKSEDPRADDLEGPVAGGLSLFLSGASAQGLPARPKSMIYTVIYIDLIRFKVKDQV